MPVEEVVGKIGKDARRGECESSVMRISSSTIPSQGKSVRFQEPGNEDANSYHVTVGWLCLTSHRQRGHLETAPLFTVPCEGREAR